MLKWERDALIGKLRATEAVKARPGLDRLLQRGEFAAVGRVLLRLEQDGRDGSAPAADVAERFRLMLERLEERAGDRFERETVFALPPEPGSPAMTRPRGRPRSEDRDWSWVARVDALLPRLPKADFSGVVRRWKEFGVRRPEVELMVALLGRINTTVWEHYTEFDSILHRLRTGRATRQEAIEFLTLTAPTADDRPLVVIDPIRLAKQATKVSAVDLMQKRERFVLAKVDADIAEVAGERSLPEAVQTVLRSRARRVFREMPTSPMLP